MKTLDQRWKRIRDLRNRVFHHERILHWNDLDQQHAEILEAIYWISRNWLNWQKHSTAILKPVKLDWNHGSTN